MGAGKPRRETTVKTIEILETGGPEVLLRIRETPTPTPGDGEVLIQVAADFGIKQKGVEA